jgi:hypothetical protein
MSQIDDETKRKLTELEQRIGMAKSSLGAHEEMAADARKDWDDMVAKHDAIRRKIDAKQQSPDALEGVAFDVDILRHSFDRWMARVEGSYAQGKGRKGGGSK